MQGSDQSVHKWNTKTDMRLLSLCCHINSPDTSMHMYINFNTLLKAGSLMISFFLMDPLDLLPSVRLKPWEKRESMKPVAQLDDFTWFWLSGGSLAWPCSSGLLNASGCAVKNSEGVEVCGHSSSPFSQSVQGPKLGFQEEDRWQAFQWTPFPKSVLCLRWIPIYSPPASQSHNWRDASHFEAVVRRPFPSAAVLSEAWERVNEQPDLPWLR